jgi:hypothetical protein
VIVRLNYDIPLLGLKKITQGTQRAQRSFLTPGEPSQPFLATLNFCSRFVPLKYLCMKKLFLTIIISISLVAKSFADEGMWLPLLLGQQVIVTW